LRNLLADRSRISWVPVVFTFTFTAREMQNDPLGTLRRDLEQLDVKFITDYNIKATTHVVSKKRNTSKGLQALINGQHIVSHTFTDAIVRAASGEDGAESALESNFDLAWPDPLQHLPPRGNEATESQVEDYGPDPGRKNIFEGYTFVFYDQAQFKNLIAPITNGGGKALHHTVVPNETEVDDFIRYVKSVAGEKGLGSFEDGSEGKGVVVVRFIPQRGDTVQWYSDFFTAVSLRLDHRMIEQGEFLDAILTKNPAMLRRPLEVEPSSEEAAASEAQDERPASRSRPRVDQEPQPHRQKEQPQPPPPRARPAKRPATKRFKGFDDDDDDDVAMADSVPSSQPVMEPGINQSSGPGDEEQGLFVSQGSQLASQEDGPTARRGTRKRPAPIPEEDDMMEDIAPAAALAKRRRIERGEDPVPRLEEAESNPSESANSTGLTATTKQKKKPKKELNILEAARKAREEAQARARADQEDLNTAGPDDVDLAEIRRLAIVEVIEPRKPAPPRPSDEEGWDPRWNGRRNFKRFRRRGEAEVRRAPTKTILPLVEVKTKGFGIGDEYWLEDDDGSRKESQSRSQGQERNSQAQQPAKAPPPPPQQRTVMSGSESEDEVEVVEMDDDEDVTVSLGIPPSDASRARSRGSRSQMTVASTATSQGGRNQGRVVSLKRGAPDASAEQAAKRVRRTRRAAPAESDSDEDQGFKFGRRR
jgi:hypothetical protein